MQHNEVIHIRINTRQIREQTLIKLRRKGVGVVRPLRLIRRLCDHRDRAVELTVPSLIAEPVRMVADLLRNIENGRRLEELLVIVLTLLCQCTLQYWYGLRPAGIGVRIDVEALALCRHVLHPRSILIREARRIVVHIVPRSGLADNEDHRPRGACRKGILGINDERRISLVLI